MILRGGQIRSFGLFTGRELPEFHRGLVLVIGENEAGKTTLLEFIRQTLFGYHEARQERPYESATGEKPSGSLVFEDVDGKLITLSRSGARGKPLLLDAKGDPLPAEVLDRLTGRLTAKAHESLYAITLDELRLLEKEKGAADVDAALYGAALGANPEALRQVREELEEAVKAIYAKRGRVTELPTLLSENQHLQQSIDAMRRRVAALANTVARRDELETSIGRLAEEHAAARAEALRARRLAEGWDAWIQHRRAAAEREALPPLDDLPWGSLWQEWDRARVDLQAVEAEVLEAVDKQEGLSMGLQAIVLDEPLLAQGSAIDALVADLSGWQSQRAAAAAALRRADDAEEDAARHLRVLGSGWDLDRARQVPLGIEAKSALDAASKGLAEAEAAERERASAVAAEEQRAQEAEGALERLGGGPVPPLADPAHPDRLALQDRRAALRQAEQAAREAERRHRDAEDAVGLVHDEREQAFQKIPPRPGGEVDVAELDRREARLADLQADLEQAARAAIEDRRVAEKLAALARERELLQESGSGRVAPPVGLLVVGFVVMAAGAAIGLRGDWETGGIVLGLGALLAMGSGCFLMRTAANSPASATRLAGLAEEEAAAQREADELAAAEETRRMRVAAAALDLGREQPPDEAALRQWRDDLRSLRRRLGEHLAAKARLDEIDARHKAAQERALAMQREKALAARAAQEAATAWSGALARAGLAADMSPDALDAVLADAAARQARITDARRDVDDAKARAARAASQHAAAREATAGARAAWEAALAAARLPAGLSPEAAAKALLAIEQALGRATEATRARAEADDATRAAAAVEARASALCEALGRPTPAADTLAATVRALAAELAAARKARDERAALARQLDDAKAAAQRLAQRAEALREQMSALLAKAGCASGEELQERLRLHEQRRALADAAARHLGEALRAAGLPDEEAARRAYASDDGEALDLPALEASSAALTEREGELAAQLEQQREELTHAKRDIDEAFADGSLEDARAQQEAVRARANDAARRWMRLRLALWLLDEARATFERDHQPEVFRLAGTLLRDITGGRHERVFRALDGDGQLSVVSPTNEVVPAHRLSRGAREQLYLALRLANASRPAAGGARLPLVLDDVLVNFDEERARRATRALARLAGETQVLLFTCHRWVRELVEAAAPPAQVITLEGGEFVVERPGA